MALMQQENILYYTEKIMCTHLGNPLYDPFRIVVCTLLEIILPAPMQHWQGVVTTPAIFSEITAPEGYYGYMVKQGLAIELIITKG